MGASRPDRVPLVWGIQVQHPQAVGAAGSEVLGWPLSVLPEWAGTVGAGKGVRQGAPPTHFGL